MNALFSLELFENKGWIFNLLLKLDQYLAYPKCSVNVLNECRQTLSCQPSFMFLTTLYLQLVEERFMFCIPY